jgi:predicted TIM-barrel fold metal-dependent hydrolase
MADTRAEAKAWLDQVIEPIVDPARQIIDPHHHLWERPGQSPYMLEDLWGDTSSGHNVVKTVYAECGSGYYEDGPAHLKPVGESEFVLRVAQASRQGSGGGHPEICGIIGRADLGLDPGLLDEVLDAHVEAAKGLFRGIRHALCCAPEGEPLMIPGGAPKGLSEDVDFRRGVKRLGARDMTYDTWHYHFQNRAFAALAQACPDTQMIIDHFGTPLGVGSYADKREEVFADWQASIAEVAKADNVVAKVGGLAMPDNGFGWMGRAIPPTSDEFVEAQGRYYTHIIECFGPQRVMFESNFPVDKFSLSYQVYWNGVKKIVSGFSEDEKNAMFSGTAARIYKV